MKLETIHQLWAEDQEFDVSKPDELIRKVPLLHSKWWRIYSDERQSFVVAKQAHDTLRHAKFEWYTGRMADEDRKKRGWAVQPLRLVRQEVDNYLDADADLMPLVARMELQELKLKFIEDVIKNINGRGYLVKSYIDWYRFSQGAA